MQILYINFYLYIISIDNLEFFLVDNIGKNIVEINI